MIAEIGHYALWLALALAVVQFCSGLWGAHRQDGRLMQVAHRATLLQAAMDGGCLRLSGLVIRAFRFQPEERGQQQQPHAAAALPHCGHLGLARRLHAAVGADAGPVDGGRGQLRPHAGHTGAQPGAGRAGLRVHRVPALPAYHLQPLRAQPAGSARWPRPEPAAAGPGHGAAPAPALPGLCGLLGGLRLCHCRHAGRPGGRRLDPLGAPLDHGGLVLPHPGHHAGQLVGLL